MADDPNNKGTEINFEDPKVKAFLEEQIQKVTAPLQESITKLETNNQALVDEKRTLESELRKAKIPGTGKGKDGKGGEDAPDIEEIRKRIEEDVRADLSATFDPIKQQNEALQKQLNKVLVDDGLKSALTAGNVASHYVEAAASLIKSKHAVEVKDGKALADGKPLEEFVKAFLAGDSGKHFVKAPGNAGGGSGNGSGAGGTPPSKPVSQMSLTEKSAFLKAHGLEAWQQKVAEESGQNVAQVMDKHRGGKKD